MKMKLVKNLFFKSRRRISVVYRNEHIIFKETQSHCALKLGSIMTSLWLKL